uniref:PH domain-containing protein n=1 Tax=Steinernema glaseri TaxID=37863 RepID=A0A1I8AES3_9BILA
MDSVPFLFVEGVFRILGSSDYDELAKLSQKGKFGNMAREWNSNWFRCYFLLHYDTNTEKFQYCQLRSTSLLDEVPVDMSVLEPVVLDNRNIQYISEYCVKIYPEKPSDGKKKLPWTTADAQDKKFRDQLNMLRAVPSTAFIMLAYEGKVKDFDPTPYLNLFPRDHVFNDILVDDFYHSEVGKLLDNSVEEGKVNFITCNRWVKERSIESLLELFEQQQFTGLLWPEDTEERPLTRRLVERWLQNIDAFTKEKSVYSAKPLLGLEVFPFTYLENVYESILRKSSIYELYSPKEQMFFELKHDQRTDRKIVLHLGARGGDFTDVYSFKEALEMHRWFDMYIQ